MNRIVTKRSSLHAMLLATWGALAAACSGAPNGDFEENAENEPVESVAQAATISQMQTAMDQFYNTSNLVTIEITMDPAEWNTLKMETPIGGNCEDLPANTERYPTHYASQVAITGSNFPARTTFTTNIEIQKKSNCGSFSQIKPSFKLKFKDANATTADNSIGTRYVTLNNSIQDPSYLRQCFGYKLFNMAGVAAPRCNVALVMVNGSRVENGIYINVEPIRERFFDNPSNLFTNRLNGASGNLYELGGADWIGRTDFPHTPKERLLPTLKIDVEKDSKFMTARDLHIAADQIASGVTGMQRVVNKSNFMKFYAMEALLSHSDGYSNGGNNTYIFNDVNAVAEPTGVGQINLKYIPWGLDQILPIEASPTQRTIVTLYSASQIARHFLNDASLREQLRVRMVSLRDSSSSPFSRSSLASNGAIQAHLNSVNTVMPWLLAGRPQSEKDPYEFALARLPLQMKILRSALITATGVPGPVYFLDAATGETMHASGTETFPANSQQFEVVHQAFANSGADRWVLSPPIRPGAWYSIKNEFYSDRYLHCSATQNTPAGHRLVNVTVNADFFGGEDYIWYHEQGEQNSYSGAFRLRNSRTNLFLRFGTDDPTVSGRQRIYQVADDANNPTVSTRIIWH